MADYLLPDVGEGLVEAELVAWRVQVGDEVAVNDIVCEIETAKSIVELPSPFAGVVSALLVDEGVTVPVGTPILRIAVAGETADPAPHDAPVAAAETAADADEPMPTLVGYGPRGQSLQRRARRASSTPTGAVPAARGLAKPSVRKAAAEAGIALGEVRGTGPGGSVTAEDLAAARSAAPGTRREPIKGVRKMMADAMTTSAFSAPHVTAWLEADVTGLRTGDHPPLVRIARAVVETLVAQPIVNSRWAGESGEVEFRDFVNLGIAVATPRGLIVPNIKDAQNLSESALASALDEAVATARAGRTQPADYADGTFTITNVGALGLDGGTPIINPGESAILSVGAIRRKPWVVAGAGGEGLAIRDVVTLALSFDHRHIDGAAGAAFLTAVAQALTD